MTDATKHTTAEQYATPVGVYSLVLDQDVYNAACALAKGSYQMAILSGREALSGATLRGKAKRWSDVYKRSAESLLKRCRAAGLKVREVTGPNNKRTLVIG